MENKTKKDRSPCPSCNAPDGQMRNGKNRSGTQRCFCKDCKKYYTLGAKTRAYSEEIQQQALRIYYSGVSGRGVGKILGMSKANVYNWIKKPSETASESFQQFNVENYELDELYWFIGKKSKSETRENIYLMTMISTLPRQIVGFDTLTKPAIRCQDLN